MRESEKQEMRSWSNAQMEAFLQDAKLMLKNKRLSTKQLLQLDEGVEFAVSELRSRVLKLLTK